LTLTHQGREFENFLKALPKLQKTRPNIRIEDIKKIPKKNSKEKSQKHQNYKIATLRPISASQLSQPQTFGESEVLLWILGPLCLVR